MIRPAAERPAAPLACSPTAVYVDSHVHLYPAFDRTAFFDAAERNVRRAGGSFGVLCLTERPTERAFDDLAGGGHGGRAGGRGGSRTTARASRCWGGGAGAAGTTRCGWW